MSRLRRLLPIVVAFAVACGSNAGAATPVDCGSVDQRPTDAYDVAGRDCVWNAYQAQRPLIWRVRGTTIEGDPIPGELTFEPGRGFVITRDVTADEFSAPSDRRVWTWRCPAIAKRVWATDPTRYIFEFTSCQGDGATAAFP
jgi:hypothetical protein